MESGEGGGRRVRVRGGEEGDPAAAAAAAAASAAVPSVSESSTCTLVDLVPGANSGRGQETWVLESTKARA